MPRDFLSDMNQEPVMENIPGRDFLAESESQKENLGTSAALALPRVAEDVIKGGYNLVKNIPNYFQSAKTEIPGLFSSFRNNPLHALSQAGAGFAEMGQNVFNYPHDIVNYLSQRLHLVPEDINKMVQMGRMPANTQEMINQTFGQPREAGESLLRGTIRNLPLITGVSSPLSKITGKSLSNLKNALNKIEPEKVISSIQKSHDILSQNASNIFENVGKEVQNRNIGNIPIRKDLISDIGEHLPKDKTTKAMLDKAFTGDYQGLRDLQSDLFKEGREYLKSPLKIERNRGKEIMSLRNELNDSIINHFKNTGHIDLADQLNEAKKMYANLQKTYYGKKTPLAIKNMVGENRKIPKNIMNVLSEESKAMEKLKSENPFAANQSKAYQNKLNAMKDLSTKWKILKYGSALGAGAIGAPLLYERYFEKKE